MKGKINKVNIKNKKAYFQYEIIEKYTAGMVLRGSEIKSIRQGKASINEAYCFINKDESFIRNMNIAEYENAKSYGHDPVRVRKLLLNKAEIQKIQKKLQEKGLTLVPLHVFLNEKGFAKIELGLGKGKKVHDKRDSIKQKDVKRELDRRLK